MPLTAFAFLAPALVGAAISAQPALAPRSVSLPTHIAQMPHGWLDRQAMNARSPRSLLYVADGTNVDIYPANSHAKDPPLIGQLTGLTEPGSLAVDAKRNLYVSQSYLGGSVAVFAEGSTTPSRTLNCEGAWPAAVAVGAHGDVFVSTADTGPDLLSVLVYHASATEPYAVLSVPFDGAFALAADRADDAFFVYFPMQSIGTVVGEQEATGKGTWSEVENLGFGIVYPEGIAFDGAGNLVVTELNESSSTLAVYPPGSMTPQTNIPLQGSSVGPSMVFNKRGDTLYISGLAVSELTYPAGVLEKTINTPTGMAFGVAVSPAARPAPRW